MPSVNQRVCISFCYLLVCWSLFCYFPDNTQRGSGHQESAFERTIGPCAVVVRVCVCVCVRSIVVLVLSVQCLLVVSCDSERVKVCVNNVCRNWQMPSLSLSFSRPLSLSLSLSLSLCLRLSPPMSTMLFHYSLGFHSCEYRFSLHWPRSSFTLSSSCSQSYLAWSWIN